MTSKVKSVDDILEERVVNFVSQWTYQHWISLTLAEPFLSFKMGWPMTATAPKMRAVMNVKRMLDVVNCMIEVRQSEGVNSMNVLAVRAEGL